MRPKILVPIDKLNKNDINIYDYIDDSSNQIKFQLSKAENSILYNLNTWRDINRITGCMIDSFEEEEITEEMQLKAVKEYLLEKINQNYESQVKELLKEIINLINEALKRNSILVFIL